MSLIPRWKQIHDLDNPQDVYLSRLMLVKLPWFGVYLHIIRRPDWSHCQHDHPWAFITLILKGGYEEEIGAERWVRYPGYVGYRPRGFEHRITRLLNGNAITLVFRFRNHETWGFRIKDGSRIPFHLYQRTASWVRVLWCDDRSTSAATEAIVGTRHQPEILQVPKHS